MSNIYQANEENIAKAAEVIKNGGLAAMPTETVYGLGANVYDAKAVAKIFAVKRRPTFDPLISHIADFDALPDYALADERALALARRFWPGPFTMVLKRRGQNPGRGSGLFGAADNHGQNAETSGGGGFDPAERSADRGAFCQFVQIGEPDHRATCL